MRAEQVEDAKVFKAFSNVDECKYGRRPRNEIMSELYLDRLIIKD